MSIQLLNIGFGNMVSANRVIAIISPESAPIKRMVQDARDKSLLIDAPMVVKLGLYSLWIVGKLYCQLFNLKQWHTVLCNTKLMRILLKLRS